MKKALFWLISTAIHLAVLFITLPDNAPKYVVKSPSVLKVRLLEIISHAPRGRPNRRQRKRIPPQPRSKKPIAKVASAAKKKRIKKKAHSKPKQAIKQPQPKSKTTAQAGSSQKLNSSTGKHESKPTKEISKNTPTGPSTLTKPLPLIPPAPIEKPKPPYPTIAKLRRYQGRVLLRILVDRNGNVAKVKIAKSSGYRVLDEAAVTAVKKWKFLPAQRENTFVPFWVEVPIVFKLVD